MRRFLLIGLLFLGLDSSLSYAQSRGTYKGDTYKDDVYYNSEDAKKDAEIEAKETKERAAYDRKRENTYSSTGNDESEGGDNKSYNRSYESDDDGYIDYDDDDYYYSNRIHRFNNPYWGFGYYTPYYNPYWYDPFYSPWSYGPSVSISVGWGWGNPYGGWNNWYGYPGFYSAWNYPYYGYGGGGGYWNGYYNGFYDGFYAGAYGGYYRNVTYGPRTSFHKSATTGVRRGVDMNSNAQQGTSGPRPQLRQSMNNNTIAENPGRTMRSADRPVETTQSGDLNEIRRAPATDRFENRDAQAQPMREMSRRNRFFDNNAGSTTENARPLEQPQSNEGRKSGRFGRQGSEQQAPVRRAQPNYDRPSYQQRAQPSYESPRMSAPSYLPSRGGNMGGGNFGGGSFGGGHRR